MMVWEESNAQYPQIKMAQQRVGDGNDASFSQGEEEAIIKKEFIEINRNLIEKFKKNQLKKNKKKRHQKRLKRELS